MQICQISVLLGTLNHELQVHNLIGNVGEKCCHDQICYAKTSKLGRQRWTVVGYFVIV